MQNHFCLQCGTPMEVKELEARTREVCPACGWVYYQQLKVGAGVMVEEEGRLLLLQRAGDPWRNAWNLPAGYVEADEKPEITAQRETFEETGLGVNILDMLNVYHFEDDPRGNGVMFVYSCEVVGGQLQQSRESLRIEYFLPAQIPPQIAGGGHDRAVSDWKNGKFKD